MVERLDAAGAREHIEMVERILAESHQRLCAGGEYFVVWGFGSGLVTLLFQMVDRKLVSSAVLWATPVILLACVVFSIVRGRQLDRLVRRRSLVQREFFNVLWLSVGLAVVVNVAVYRIFQGAAAAAIWSVAEAIVLLYIGMHGNRRAQIAGVLVVVSMVVANFVSPSVDGFVLAAGMIFGYGGFGVAELLTRDETDG